jgi:hypothetical protein
MRCLELSLLLLLALPPGAAIAAETTQQHVHSMAKHVMPFDMAKTEHVFRMTESGGVQTVQSRDPAAQEQVRMIRMHLKQEAASFQAGNFADPAMLHGADMPGLKELSEGAAQIKVTYSDTPAGGQITFHSDDLRLITAVHRWFGAQLSEHGADARAE